MKWKSIILTTLVMIVMGIEVLAGPLDAIDTLPYIINTDEEKTNISFYAEFNDVKLKIPYTDIQTSKESWGFIVDEDAIKTSLATISFDWDKKLYYKIDSTQEYIQSPNNPYVLERDLGYTQLVRNQMGLLENRPAKRFIDFSQIFKKESNIYNTTEVIINKTSSISVKTRKYTDYSFTQDKDGNWVVMFENIFDLDPSFLDDTDSEWYNGTFVNMVVDGSGSDANLTSATDNTQGSFGSRILDAGIKVNWTNISVSIESCYGTHIGECFNDSKDAKEPFINSSGLVGYWRFNNRTDENDSLFKDFSVDVNEERIGEADFNGSCNLAGNLCPTYSDSRIGAWGMDFDGDDDEIAMGTGNPIQGNHMSFFMWINMPNTGQRTYADLGGKPVDSDASTPYSISRNAGSNGLTARLSTGSAVTINFGSGVFDNTWHFIGFTYGGVDIRSFVDGVFDDNALQTGNIIQNSNTIYIGQSGSANREIEGKIDEVSLWNRTLNESEIVNLYRRGAMRLNLSYRTCDDGTCDGEDFIEIHNKSFMGGKIQLNNSIKNRYFQYNLTYSRNTTDTTRDRIVINNVSIEASTDSITYVGNTTGLSNGDSTSFNSSTFSTDKGNYLLLWLAFEETQAGPNITQDNVNISQFNGITWELIANRSNTNNDIAVYGSQVAESINDIKVEVNYSSGGRAVMVIERFNNVGQALNTCSNAHTGNTKSLGCSVTVSQTNSTIVTGASAGTNDGWQDDATPPDFVFDTHISNGVSGGDRMGMGTAYNLSYEETGSQTITWTDPNFQSQAVMIALELIPPTIEAESGESLTGVYVEPTDINNATIKDRNWTYINITPTNTSPLDRVLLNWNMTTNITLFGNGLNLNYHMESDASDDSGQANTGIETGNGIDCTSSIDGYFGSGCSFAGTNDYIQIPDHKSINSSPRKTVMAWIKITDVTGNRELISKYVAGSNTLDYLVFWAGAVEQLRCYFGDDDANDAARLTLSSGVLNTWRHVACVYDGTDTILYLDGQKRATAVTPTAPNPSGTDLFIGARATLTNDYTGNLDEIKIYNRSLTPEEINITWRSEFGRYFMNITNNTPFNAPETYHYQVVANDTNGLISNFSIRNVTFIPESGAAAPPADTCTYSSGDWNIDCSDNCVISSDVSMPNNDIHTYGTGTLTIKAMIDARNVYNRCDLFCYNTPACFG